MIELADIPAAVADYLDTNVTTTISTVTPGHKHQDVLTPGQDGTFIVTVENAPSPDGIRLINVKYHLKISRRHHRQADRPPEHPPGRLRRSGQHQPPDGRDQAERDVRPEPG